MNLQEQMIKKTCGCYANNWHLTTMLLPYVTKKIEKEESIITVLKEGIEDKIKKLIDNLKITPEMKEKIKKIDWTPKEKIFIEELKSTIEENKSKEITILITGTKEEMERQNKEIEQIYYKNENKEIILHIINLYKMSEINDIYEILNGYEFVINTSGIHKIQEIYPNYNKETKTAVANE